MRTRLLALAAAGGIAVAALPAHAATAPKPQITDPTGDANGVNQQVPGFGPNPSSQSTGPAEVAAADITAVTFQTTFVTKVIKKKVHGELVKKRVKVPTGMTATMALAAAPATPSIIYRISVTAPNCETNIFFEYTSGGSTVVRCPNTDVTKPSTTYAVPAAVIKDKTITWTVPLTSIPVGTVFASLNAQTRQQVSTPLVSATVPQYDYATGTSTFTVGK